MKTRSKESLDISLEFRIRLNVVIILLKGSTKESLSIFRGFSINYIESILS